MAVYETAHQKLARKVTYEREEFLMFAMVQLLEPHQPFVQEMNREFNVEHGNLEFTDYDFNGMVFERAHIITSKARQAD